MVARTKSMGRFMLLIAFVAFISLGLPDGLLGVAWPSMRANFGIPLDSMATLLASSVTGYLISSMLSGGLVRRLGIGRLLALSCALTATALFGYTVIPQWWMVIGLGMIGGFGAGAIDAGINNFIAHRYRHMLYLLHAMFGIGTTLGPLIMTTALNVSTWRAGYIIVGIFQIGLAAVFFWTADRWEADDDPVTEVTEAVPHARLVETIRRPWVWLSIVLFLVYTGIEVSFGQWSYTYFTEGRGVTENIAGLFVGFYWGAFTMGRILSSLIVRVIPEKRYLRLSFLGAIVGGALIAFSPIVELSLAGLPLVGFSLAPIFPALIGSTDSRVGKRHAANTIGFQIGAASLGGAVVAGIAGAMAQAFGLHMLAIVNLIAAAVVTLLHELTLMRAPEDNA